MILDLPVYCKTHGQNLKECWLATANVLEPCVWYWKYDRKENDNDK